MLRHPLLGAMKTPDCYWPTPPGMPWAADCGLKIAKSSDPRMVDKYLAWLDRQDREGNLFATAPDVYGDAAATWRRSSALLPLVRALGYRVALVAQDGFDADAVDWSAFDQVFIGGTRTWKRSEAGGYAAIRAAVARGVPVHVGMVNGGAFLRNVAMAGATSADGTGLAINPGHWPRVRRWLDGLAVQPSLGLERVV